MVQIPQLLAGAAQSPCHGSLWHHPPEPLPWKSLGCASLGGWHRDNLGTGEGETPCWHPCAPRHLCSIWLWRR